MKKALFVHLVLLLLMQLAFLLPPAAADQADDFERIEAAIASGDALEAQTRIEDFLDDYPAGRRAVKALYLLGQLHYRRAAYQDAGDAFSRLLEDHPDWEYADRTLYGLAMSQIGMLNYSGAGRSLEKLLSSYPESELHPEALYWLGEALYRRGDFSAALRQFDEFIRVYPGHSLREYALDSAGWCLEQLGRHAEAAARRREFLYIFKNSPLSATAEYCLAADLVRAGNLRSAADRYLTIAEASPEFHLQEQALLRAGLLFAELAETQKSVTILEKAVPKTSGNDHAMAKAVLGNNYLKLQAYEKARATLESHLEVAPADEYAIRIQLALSQMGLGNFSEAADLLAISAYGGKNAESEQIRGLMLIFCLLNLGEPKAAAEQIGALLADLEPASHSSALLFAYAGALILDAQFERAGEILARLVEDERWRSKNPEVDYYYGLCLIQQAKYSAAKEYLERYVNAQNERPLRARAQYLLADACAEEGEFELSCKRYQTFLETWPNDSLAPAASYRVGLLSLLTGKYERALSVLEKFAADNPSAAAAVAAKYFAGIGYVRSGQPQKAVRIYELLVREQIDPRLADNVAFGYGLAEFAQGNFREADRILRRFASQHIDSEVIDAAIFFAAASRFERGLIADADAEFLNFAGLFASSSLYAHALLFAGLCEEKLNHPENALILYERASESGISQNSCLVATAGRAAASMAMGDTERALALLALMAEEQRGNAAGEAALFWTGRLLYASGQWNEAQAALEEFTKAYPASPLADDAFFFSARAARTETDYPAAVRLFRALNSQYQESVFAERSVVESAECMLEAGEALDAARTFKEFIDNNVASPLRPLALYNMGKALQRTGKYVEAIEQFKAAAGGETNELAAGSHFAIAECLSELDRSGEAVAVLVGMVGGAYPPDWAERAQLQVARLLERDGQVDEARHVYASIVQTYQRDAAGIVAKRALDRLKIEKVVSAQ